MLAFCWAELAGEVGQQGPMHADDHLNYALTWALLSATTAFLATRLLSKGAGLKARSRRVPRPAAA